MSRLLPSNRTLVGLRSAGLLGAGGLAVFAQTSDEPRRWKQHDMSRPPPRVVTPGTASTADQPGKPPSDAIVLFDGKDLAQWQSRGRTPAAWKVVDGYME